MIIKRINGTICCLAILLLSYNDILAQSGGPYNPREAYFQNKLSTIKEECQESSNIELKSECYKKQCATFKGEEKVRCSSYSCDEVWGSDVVNKQKCSVQSIDEETSDLSDSDLVFKFVNNYSLVYGVVTGGNLVLVVLDFILKKTILKIKSECVFPSVIVASTSATIADVMHLISIIIYFKGSSELAEKFEDISQSEDIQKKSIEYLRFKLDLVKNHLIMTLVRYSIAVALTATALGLAIKELTVGGGFCSVDSIFKNDLFSFDWAKIIPNAYALGDDINYRSSEYENPQDETFISNLASNVGIRPDEIGRMILHGRAYILVFQIIYHLYDLVGDKVMPAFNGAWNSNAQMNHRTAVGRVIFLSICVLIRTALVVLTSITLNRVIEKQKMLDSIESIIEKNKNESKGKSIETSSVVKLIISEVIAQTDDENNFLKNQSGKDENVCINSKGEIDFKCSCRRNGSCYKFDLKMFKDEFGSSVNIEPLIDHFNKSMRGDKNYFDYSRTEIDNVNNSLAKIVYNRFNNIPLDKEGKKIFKEKSIDELGLNYYNQLPKKQIETVAPYMYLLDPYIYVKGFTPKNLDLNSIQQIDDEDGRFITGEMTSNPEMLLHRGYEAKLENVGVSNGVSDGQFANFSSIAINPKRNIWEIISLRYLNHFYIKNNSSF